MANAKRKFISLSGGEKKFAMSRAVVDGYGIRTPTSHRYTNACTMHRRTFDKAASGTTATYGDSKRTNTADYQALGGDLRSHPRGRTQTARKPRMACPIKCAPRAVGMCMMTVKLELHVWLIEVKVHIASVVVPL
jgi:hypothetical protein